MLFSPLCAHEGLPPKKKEPTFSVGFKEESTFFQTVRIQISRSVNYLHSCKERSGSEVVLRSRPYRTLNEGSRKCWRSQSSHGYIHIRAIKHKNFSPKIFLCERGVRSAVSSEMFHIHLEEKCCINDIVRNRATTVFLPQWEEALSTASEPGCYEIQLSETLRAQPLLREHGWSSWTAAGTDGHQPSAKQHVDTCATSLTSRNAHGVSQASQTNSSTV